MQKSNTRHELIHSLDLSRCDSFLAGRVLSSLVFFGENPMLMSMPRQNDVKFRNEEFGCNCLSESLSRVDVSLASWSCLSGRLQRIEFQTHSHQQQHRQATTKSMPSLLLSHAIVAVRSGHPSTTALIQCAAPSQCLEQIRCTSRSMNKYLKHHIQCLDVCMQWLLACCWIPGRVRETRTPGFRKYHEHISSLRSLGSSSVASLYSNS